MIVFGKAIRFICPPTLADTKHNTTSFLQLKTLIPAKMHSPGRANKVPSITENAVVKKFPPSEQREKSSTKLYAMHITTDREELLLNFA